MVQINCPLCCNETFDSPSTLKCHLVEILENLMCPNCHNKFDKVADFVEHLDTDCTLIIEIQDESIESPGSIEAEDDNGQLSESILARALLEGGKTELAVEQAQYYCQSCSSNFTDIDEHLNSFHQGQEIILQEETVKSTDVSSEENSPPPRKKKRTMTQDIQDKDGRLYTRKFVKIDKFWLQDELIEDPTSIQQSNVVEVALCQTCDTCFPTSETHECLVQETEPKEAHICDICNTSFPSLKSLRLHRRMHMPMKTREIEATTNEDEKVESFREIFVCKICKKTYDKEYEQVHMGTHEYNNGFNCGVCNRKFYTKPNLEMHMKAHTNNKKFTCSYCKKPFVTYDALNEHLQNQCQKRPYACQYCGRRFTRPHEKVKHERIHTGEKPHVCEICGKAFRVSYCLTLHLRTHSGSRPYQCKHCGKRFKSHSVYNHHLLTHSDVRAYKCPYCPKAFKTSVQLAGHKNSHIKPFTCTECNRPFASLYAVRAHMETHKRENNLKYECWICGALYSRAFALRDHLKQQHQQAVAEKEKAEVVGVAEEMEAANSILVNEDDIILGLEGATSIEIIENEGE